MKGILIVLIVLLVLGLLLYTKDTIETISIVGKHSYSFVKNVYHDLGEKADRGDYDRIEEDIKEKYDKIS